MLLSVLSCATLGYYGQAVTGHLRLVSAREPISDLLESGEIPEETREKLRTVQAAREFASRALHLPDNRSYRYFAQLDRPYAVWNVVATPRFSIEPRKWCFPVAGCVSYRGYFDRDAAERFAAGLRDEGLDVALSGATAYSTLGWFADPVLSTMLDYPDAELAGLIFHELAHQRLYVKGDTAFNESFATVVEEAGVRRWLESRGDTRAFEAWRRRRERHRAFTGLLMETRESLSALYRRADSMDAAAMRREKRALFDDLRERYRALSREWPEDPYGNWMAQDLNNAHLALVSAYRGGTPAFEAMLERVNGDLERFYAEAERVAGWPDDRRKAWLEGVIETARR